MYLLPQRVVTHQAIWPPWQPCRIPSAVFLPVALASSRDILPSGKIKLKTAIYVGNLPEGTSQRDFLWIFSVHGNMAMIERPSKPGIESSILVPDRPKAVNGTIFGIFDSKNNMYNLLLQAGKPA